MKKIAIVGGGPAGALCGEKLASANFDVTLFDEHLAWEKPCGGGLTHKAIARYPFLLTGSHPKREVRCAELISCRGERTCFDLSDPIIIYSRRELNALLLERAAAAGCKIVKARVTHLDTQNANAGECVKFFANGLEQRADFVVIAGGARNQLLPETTPLQPKDLEVTFGYFVPVSEETLKIKFLDHMAGYIWSFPRADHLSVGICAKMGEHTTAELKNLLEAFLREENLPLRNAQLFSHVLPSPRADTLRSRKIDGGNWALAGDAAAFVDPITGEGLYYALRSGELLAEAIVLGRPEEYAAMLHEEFLAELEIASNLSERFFRGRFLGGAVTTRMVQFARRSTTFRDLLRDLFSGTQSYAGLRRRLWGQLVVTLCEITGDFLRSPHGNPGFQEES